MFLSNLAIHKCFYYYYVQHVEHKIIVHTFYTVSIFVTLTSEEIKTDQCKKVVPIWKSYKCCLVTIQQNVTLSCHLSSVENQSPKTCK